MLTRLRFLVPAVGAMLLLGVVVPGQVSNAEAFVYPDTAWTYPPNVPPNKGGTFASGLPAVAPNGMVYAAGKLYGYPDQFHDDYYLFKFFPEDGTVAWKKQLTFREETTQHPILVSAPAVAPNGVVYIWADGRIFAFYPDGKEKWHYDAGVELPLSIPGVAFDGTIYIGAVNKLLAFTPAGNLKWTFTDPNNVPYHMSPPVIGADGSIYVTRGDVLYAVKPDGEKKWQFSKGAILGMPVIGQDNTLYISASAKNPVGLGLLYAVSDKDGSLKWTQYLVGSPHSPVIGPYGDLYLGTRVGCYMAGGSCSGVFYAIKSDGDARWAVNLEKPVAGMASVGYFNRIFFSVGGTQLGDAELYVLEGDFGGILGQYNIVSLSTSPILDLMGNIYLSTNMKFWAIKDTLLGPYDKSGPSFSAWPLVRQWYGGTGTAEELAKKWEFGDSVTLPVTRRLGLLLSSSPAIAPDGTIYMSGFECAGPDCNPYISKVYAVKPDGQKKWEYGPEPGFDALYFQPVLAPDGTAYVLAVVKELNSNEPGYAKLFAFGPNGNKKWTFLPPGDEKAGYAAIQPALAPDGTIYFTTSKNVGDKYVGRLHAVNPITGTERWNLPLDSSPTLFTPPVVGKDGTIYLLMGPHAETSDLYVIKPGSTSGAIKWKIGINSSGTPWNLIIGLGRLYVTTIAGSVYSISQGGENTPPSLQWERTFEGGVTGSPTLGLGGTTVGMLLVPVKEKLVALEPWTGDTVWEEYFFRSPGEPYLVTSTTVGADGTIYVQDILANSSAPPDWNEGGRLWAVNPNGTPRWSFYTSPGWGSPAVAPDGTVYAKTLRGKLYALKGLTTGLAASDWPTAGHDSQRSGRLMQTVQSGSPILIEVTDPNTESQPTTLLFETVLSPGWVNLTTPPEMVAPPPPDYLNVDPPFVREVQTTADFTGMVNICFDIGPLNYFKRENLRVFHRESDAWVDRTSPPPAGEVSRVCASVDSFSQFAIFQPGKFTGFFPPVAKPPKLNPANAGQAIPVKFSLDGNQGLNIFSAGYPASQRIDCTTKTPLDSMQGTTTAGASSLIYDPTVDQYVYVWKTDKAWAGTCRQLLVRLNDGSTHRANFSFK